LVEDYQRSPVTPMIIAVGLIEKLAAGRISTSSVLPQRVDPSVD